MPAVTADSAEPYYWDAFRDTSVGRYLFRYEQAFIMRSLGAIAGRRGVLDVGCGSGRLTVPLHNGALAVVGLDLSPVALRAFRRRCTAVPLVMGDAVRLPFADASFEGVIAIQSFDYVPHHQFLRECHRVLCHGGLVVFDALNRRSYKGLLKLRLGRTLSLPSADLARLPSANLDGREVLRATAEHGFEIEAVSGYNWVPFTRHSDSKLVGPAALLERGLRLDRHPSLSPKILVAARKRYPP